QTGGIGPLTGASLGWSGQGTFTTDFHTSSLNGEVQMQGDGPSISTWYMNIAPTAASLPTPVQGALGESFIRLTVQPCLIDWHGDFRRSVQDLFDFLSDYFRGAPGADVDGSGSIAVGDIFTFLSLYFAGCGGF